MEIHSGMTDSMARRIALCDGEFEKYKGTKKVRKEVKVLFTEGDEWVR